MASVAEVERGVKEVYDFCPPTNTLYSSPEGREQYKRQWGQFLIKLGMSPTDFRGLKVLDAGCGSCEKATFYHDWGARVTGLDFSEGALSLAKEVIGQRDIALVKGSLLSYRYGEPFDVIIADGVLHHTAETMAALRSLIVQLTPRGHLIFSLVNVWGTFWWFPNARNLARTLGGSNFHERARWGSRLFGWTRRYEEGTQETSQIFRSRESWAYDWFANPRWNLHSPSQVRSWLKPLGLRHVRSVPSIVELENPRNPVAGTFRKLFGRTRRAIDVYWLLNLEPNMMYVHAVKA